MSGLVQTPVKFIGKTYVKEDGSDVTVCVDSETIEGIVLMFFGKQDIGNAEMAAAALNIWAGKE